MRASRSCEDPMDELYEAFGIKDHADTGYYRAEYFPNGKRGSQDGRVHYPRLGQRPA